MSNIDNGDLRHSHDSRVQEPHERLLAGKRAAELTGKCLAIPVVGACHGEVGAEEKRCGTGDLLKVRFQSRPPRTPRASDLPCVQRNRASPAGSDEFEFTKASEGSR